MGVDQLRFQNLVLYDVLFLSVVGQSKDVYCSPQMEALVLMNS